MRYLFFLGVLISFSVVVLLVGALIRRYRKENIRKVLVWFSLLSLGYLLFLMLHVLWFVGKFEFFSGDLIILNSLVLIFQTLVFYKVFNYFLGDSRIYFWLLVYLLGLGAIVFTPLVMFNFLSIISLLLLMLVFYYMYSGAGYLRKSGEYGLIYSSLSVLFQFLILLNIGEPIYYWLISGFGFLIFSYRFLKDVQGYSGRLHLRIRLKQRPRVLLFVQFFVFIIVLTNLALISTIGLHELGHVALARMYGCESRSIIYEEGNYPYSEIICKDLSGKIQISLAGPILPILFALGLYLVGGRYVRPLSFLVLGFNFVASYGDLDGIGLSQSLVLLVVFAGVVFLFAGVTLLARSRVNEFSNNV